MTAAPRNKLPSWLILVAAMTAVGPVSIDMYLPGFPLIEREFGERGVEGTMAAFIIGIAVGQLFYGPISDRFGRKPPLYVGFFVYMLGALGCAFAVNMTMLTMMRVLQALGGCAGMVIGRAIVRDRCEPHEAAKAFTTLTLIVSLGPVLAPAIGGWVVGLLGWRATFIVQALLAMVMLFAMHKVLTESHVERDASVGVTDVVRNYLRLVRDRQFIAFSLVLGFSMTSMFCYVVGAPKVITQNYGLSPPQFGSLIGLNGLAFMAASLLNMHSLRSLTPRQVLERYIWLSPLLGVTLLVLSLLVQLPLWAVVGLQLMFFVSVGRIGPNVSALALAPHGHNAGTASALMGATQSALVTVGGLAVAVFNDGAVHTLAAIMATSAVLAVLCYSWVRRTVPPLPVAGAGGL